MNSDPVIFAKLKLKLSDRIYHCNVCGLTIDRDLNAAINVLRRGMQSLEENEEKETEHVGSGTPEFTPVEIGSIPERANPVVETGSSLRQMGRMSRSIN